ncbi:MAG: hypothetical protein FWD55_01575 [Propionibacteriaceae bacterium]|nr:hypothetical protein [Propionibacteriaceae bacterium]
MFDDEEVTRIPASVKWLIPAALGVVAVGAGFLIWRWTLGANFSTDPPMRIGLIVMIALILIIVAVAFAITTMTNRTPAPHLQPPVTPSETQVSVIENTDTEEFTHAPVIPPDLAQGYGWRKASDLANEQENTTVEESS